MSLSLLPTNAVLINQVAVTVYGVAPGATLQANFEAHAKDNGIDATLNLLLNSAGLGSDANFNAIVLANLGLASDAVSVAYMESSVAANGRLATMKAAFDFLGSVAGQDNQYGTAGTAFNSKVTKSIEYSSVATNTSASTDAVSATAIATGSTFTLTTGTDSGTSFAGSASNDTYASVLVAAGGTGTTINAGDSLNGGAGTDTLNISATGDVDGFTLAGVVTTGVEKVLVSNFDTDAVKVLTVEGSLFSGATTVGLSASGANGDTKFDNLGTITAVEYAGAGDLEVAYNASAVTGTSDIQDVTLNGSSGALTIAGVETINLTSATTKNTISTLTADAAKTLTIAGDQNLTITNELSATVANIKTIDASSATGKVSIVNDDTTTNATLGSGADTYKTGAAVAADYAVDGGAGEDTLSVTASTVLDTAVETARYTNFEALQINNIAATTTAFNQDMSLLTGFDAVTLVAQDSTDSTADSVMSTALSKVSNGTTITIKDLTTAETAKFTASATITHADDTASDDIAFVLGSSTAGAGANVTDATNAKIFLSLKAANAETVTVTSQGGSNLLGTLDSADMTSLTVLGDKALEIHDINNATKLATVDASGMTAAFTMTGSNASTTAGTYTGSAKGDTLLGGTKGDTINGGAGDDTINGANGDNTLNGEAGDDVITGGTGADTISGGAGDDQIKFGSANLTSLDTVDGGAGANKITITDAATVVDADFTNVTNVQTLETSTGTGSITLGELANASGLTTVDADATGNTTVTPGAKFTNDLKVVLSDDNDTVAASAYTGSLTVTIDDDAHLDGNDTLTGGTGVDTLSVKIVTGATITATELASVSGFEVFKIANNASTNTITLADANIADGKGMTVDGTALTSDSAVLTVVGTNETNGVLTVLGGAGNDVITGSASDLGDVLTGNGGDDTFKFATANLTKLDTVTGGAGDDTLQTTDTGTLVDADFTGVTQVENLTLGASSTVTLDSIAQTAGFSKYTLGTGTNKVTLKAGFTNDLTLNLVAGTDTVDGSVYTGALTIAVADDDHLSADTLTGGTGSNDTLSVKAALLTDTELANVTKFEKIVSTSDATANIKLHNNNAAAGASLTVDASALVSTNAATLDASNETDGLITLIAGAAGDTITMSASASGGDTISAGAGDDTIKVSAANLSSLDTIDGGAGTDKIVLTAAGTVADSAFANVTSVETLDSANANQTVILDSNAAASGLKTLNLVTGSNTNSVVLSAGFTNDLTIALTDNTDTVTGTAYTGALTVTVAEDNLTNADTLTGGSGSDTLTITFDDNSGDKLTAAEMINVTGFETIKSASNTVGNLDLNDANIASGKSMTIDVSKNTGDAFTLDASAELDGTITYVGGGGVDTVTGGAKADTIGGGAGADVITGGKGADILTGGAGADVFTYTKAEQSTTSGADSITDFVSGTDKIAVTLDFSSNTNGLTFDATVNTAAAGTDAIQAGLSGSIGQATYDTTNSQLVINADANNLITTNDYVIGVNAATTAKNTVAEGDINYTITGGSAGDIIVAGGGADTINGGAGVDTITGGAGNDTITLTTGEADTVVLSALANNGADTLVGFDGGTSKLNVAALGTFTALAVTNDGTDTNAAGSEVIDGHVFVISTDAQDLGAVTATDHSPITDFTDVTGTGVNTVIDFLNEGVVSQNGTADEALFVINDGNADAAYLYHYVDTVADTATDLTGGTLTLVATIGMKSGESFATGDLVLS